MAKQIAFCLAIDYKLFASNFRSIFFLVEEVIDITISTTYTLYFIDRQVYLAMKDDKL